MSFNAQKFIVRIHVGNKRQDSYGENVFISCMMYISCGEKTCKKISQRNKRSHKREKRQVYRDRKLWG